MTATLTPPTVARKAARLVAASERLSFDPFTDVDWSLPLDDSMYYLPPEYLPLYGTPVWEAMDDTQRKAYSRHECASLCSAGIWFENILMQLILKHLYDLPADDGSHRYLLVEAADECRHSAMFGEFIRRAGTPAYSVQALLGFGGRFLTATTPRGPEGYLAILAAEELLDASNRATMNDERVHPVSRQMARLHVLEEARHVSYARSYVTETWPRTSGGRRLVAMIRAPFVVRSIVDALCNPAVYDELRIPDGRRTAARNPIHRERLARDLGRLTGFLRDTGVVATWTLPLWRLVGLGAAVQSSPDPVLRSAP
ncbi:MAG: diiron oxygenase [Acidimicrobiales bacterium]|jgi:hypothetical protein|nr:diiron oxygenase [Acidimicrobiales bacterium]